MLRFQDQVVVITGAGRGIGYALAERFAGEGAKVVIAELNVELGAAAAQKLGAHYEQLDVSKSAEVARVVDAIVERFGRIDVWVNNAGIAHKGYAVDLAPEDWDADISVLLSGPFYCAQRVGQVMIKQGKGSVVNISSVNGLFAQKGRGPYSSAKAGLIMLTKVLASEWAEHGVRVNAVAPGVVMTELVQQGIDQGLVTEQTYHSRIPMGRMGTLDEVSEAVLFLASDEASYVTGDVLRVDGGWTAYHLFYPFEEAFENALEPSFGEQ
ncbi:MAG: SDR family oxidoreductase [Burkholderiales bacterium]|nr:SDR family oxidoreductase [Anaerolineae bacterium]